MFLHSQCLLTLQQITLFVFLFCLILVTCFSLQLVWLLLFCFQVGIGELHNWNYKFPKNSLKISYNYVLFRRQILHMTRSVYLPSSGACILVFQRCSLQEYKTNEKINFLKRIQIQYWNIYNREIIRKCDESYINFTDISVLFWAAVG